MSGGWGWLGFIAKVNSKLVEICTKYLLGSRALKYILPVKLSLSLVSPLRKRGLCDFRMRVETTLELETS